MLKLFMRAKLLDSGSEVNEFETIILNKYGTGKHSFTLDDINEVIVLFASNFFIYEYEKDPRLILSIIFKTALIPYIENNLKDPRSKLYNNSQTNLAKLL
jgi:hypothetical protein